MCEVVLERSGKVKTEEGLAFGRVAMFFSGRGHVAKETGPLAKACSYLEKGTSLAKLFNHIV